MADIGPILVTGAAGQLGGIGRTVTGLLLDRGLRVRAMVHREDDRATDCLPKVAVPKHRRDTIRPVLPNFVYFI